MSFEERADAVVAALDGEELKLVYRVLHRHLAEHTDLLDTHFLIELQKYLQRRAKADGVDIADHSAWDRWLGNDDAPPCDRRVRNRRTIDPE
jgi:hypothetical protein